MFISILLSCNIQSLCCFSFVNFEKKELFKKSYSSLFNTNLSLLKAKKNNHFYPCFPVDYIHVYTISSAFLFSLKDKLDIIWYCHEHFICKNLIHVPCFMFSLASLETLQQILEKKPHLFFMIQFDLISYIPNYHWIIQIGFNVLAFGFEQ